MPKGKRRCAARGCQTQVNRAALMCGEHWSLVPNDLKRELSSAYKARGGVPNAPMTDRYAQAMLACIRAVAEIITKLSADLVEEALIMSEYPIPPFGDDTPIGSDQPPALINPYDDPQYEPGMLPAQRERARRWYEKTMLFAERYGGAKLATLVKPGLYEQVQPPARLYCGVQPFEGDVTGAFVWQGHKQPFILLERVCHYDLIKAEFIDDNDRIIGTFECKPCGIKRIHTFLNVECSSCYGKGGTLSTDSDGDGIWSVTYDTLDPCGDCLENDLCPGCGNNTINAQAYLDGMIAPDDLACKLCGWSFDIERFNSDPSDYDYDEADTSYMDSDQG